MLTTSWRSLCLYHCTLMCWAETLTTLTICQVSLVEARSLGFNTGGGTLKKYFFWQKINQEKNSILARSKLPICTRHYNWIVIVKLIYRTFNQGNIIYSIYNLMWTQLRDISKCIFSTPVSCAIINHPSRRDCCCQHCWHCGQKLTSTLSAYGGWV